MHTQIDDSESMPAPQTGVNPWVYAPLSDKAIYDFSHKVMDLLFKHSNPPDPIAYSVWFAYVAQKSDGLRRQIDQLLTCSGKITRADIIQLYRVHIEDGNREAMSQNLGLELEDNLNNVSNIIGKSVDQNRGFGEALKETSAEIETVQTPEDLKQVVTKVATENMEMSRLTNDISQELVKTQNHITMLNQKLEDLQSLSLRDPLTSVANRRAFEVRLKEEVEKAQTSNHPLSLAIADIDHFKRVNDTLGHQIGDQVIKKYAEFLNDNTAEEAMIARYGGEEFAIILANTSAIDAHNLMIDLSHRFTATKFLTDQQHNTLGPLTASIGLTRFKPDRTTYDMISIADKQLYAAKDAGRNCVKTEGLG